MARIKHIALSTDDPVKTAEFYKSIFGLTELRRMPPDTGAEGVWLSDGYIYFAILKYGGAENPTPCGGPATSKREQHIRVFYGELQESRTHLLEGCRPPGSWGGKGEMERKRPHRGEDRI